MRFELGYFSKDYDFPGKSLLVSRIKLTVKEDVLPNSHVSEFFIWGIVYL